MGGVGWVFGEVSVCVCVCVCVRVCVYLPQRPAECACASVFLRVPLKMCESTDM